MSAASGCYLNFIMVGIYLAKNNFNSKNYVFVVCMPFSYRKCKSIFVIILILLPIDHSNIHVMSDVTSLVNIMYN